MEAAGAGTGAKQRFVLNSSDGTFQEIRNWHIGSVGIWLNEQAKSFHSGYKGSKVCVLLCFCSWDGVNQVEELHVDMQAAELKELKEFTTKLKTLPQIQRHIELLAAAQRVSGQPAFRARVAAEQALLDTHSVDAACEAVEVRSWSGS